MSEETPLRNLKTIVIWLVLLLAVYFVHGFPDVWWFLGCAWCCFLVAGLSIVAWEDRSLWKGALKNLGNARWWLFDERNRFKDWCRSEAAKIEQLPDRQHFERSSELALANLHSANQRYKKALTFSIGITLLMFFIAPFNQAAACGLLLNMAPHLLRSMEDSEASTLCFPLNEIKKLSRGRDTFANAVWSIAITLILVAVLAWTFDSSRR